MRRIFTISILCLLLICTLISCDTQGLVGELQSEQADKTQQNGFFGSYIGTDEEGNYIITDDKGSTIVGDFAIIQGGGSQVIIGGGGRPSIEPDTFDPLAMIDTYELSAFRATKEETDYVKITVRDLGEIVVLLCPETAPETVENFKMLVGQGFYNGLVFHRIIQNFMIQGGGYDENGEMRQTDKIKGEFEANGFDNDLKHLRGVISMARTNVPNSATSQFFICDTDNPHLDGQYAAFGCVLAGMETVDKIAAVQTGYGDKPLTPVVIESVVFVELTMEQTEGDKTE